MNDPQPAEVSREPLEGWHCSHLYYRFDRAALNHLGPSDAKKGREELAAALDPAGPGAPARMQSLIITGQKADFGVMLLDPDPLTIDSVHQRLMSGRLGPALIPAYSFVSMTEISEYVPSPEQYAQRLRDEGETEGSASYTAKTRAYESRLVAMNRQRLTPDFPPWPATCFYPMNKMRQVGENWFLLPFPERNRMMAEHGRTGMTFGGKVTQLITVGLGVEDWEWGVTLWARNPQFLREIVYRMRFDEASARFAEFGPFYTGYVASPDQILEHCRVGGGGGGG